MTFKDFKDLPIRTASDKVVRSKAFNIAKNFKYDGYKRDFASMVYKCFDKKSSATNPSATHASKLAGGAVKKEIMSNQELANLLQTIYGVLILLICN